MNETVTGAVVPTASNDYATGDTPCSCHSNEGMYFYNKNRPDIGIFIIPLQLLAFAALFLGVVILYKKAFR